MAPLISQSYTKLTVQTTLQYIEKLGAKSWSFWFKPEKPLQYMAGQFTEIYLPHPNPDKRGELRWFTLSSAPSEDLVGITTEFAHHGSSFKHALRHLPIGATLQMSEPIGDFVLPKDRRIPLLFVAAGLGITPVRSIVAYLQAKQEQRTVHILHSVRTAEQLLFRDLFTSYELTYQPFISRQQGRLSADHILAASDTTPTTDLIYLAGPESMVESLARELRAKGIADRRLIMDAFPGYRRI